MSQFGKDLLDAIENPKGIGEYFSPVAMLSIFVYISADVIIRMSNYVITGVRSPISSAKFLVEIGLLMGVYILDNYNKCFDNMHMIVDSISTAAPIWGLTWLITFPMTKFIEFKYTYSRVGFLIKGAVMYLIYTLANNFRWKYGYNQCQTPEHQQELASKYVEKKTTF